MPFITRKKWDELPVGVKLWLVEIPRKRNKMDGSFPKVQSFCIHNVTKAIPSLLGGCHLPNGEVMSLGLPVSPKGEMPYCLTFAEAREELRKALRRFTPHYDWK
ncbi:MAG: hypothetical protein WCT37_01795 [Patescibacteria group bacterium]|jgi:hypothetical protein